MTLFRTALLATSLALLAQAPQPSPAARPFLGSWTGTLTYRDYKSDAQVVLPTTLDVSADGASLRFAYVYQDGPSKVVRDQELVRIDETAGTVEIDGDGKDVYNATGLHELAAAGSGRLTLLGTGTDNDRPVDVRETIDIGSGLVYDAARSKTQRRRVLHAARLRVRAEGAQQLNYSSDAVAAGLGSRNVSAGSDGGN